MIAVYPGEAISSDNYLQFTPRDINKLQNIIEAKGRYAHYVNHGVPYVQILGYLEKAIKIVKNTEDYTEYLLFEAFGDKKAYNKLPPGTIRIYAKTLVCFWNGRTWRKLK